jgi:signal transduction histidine kinase/ligand-binding sensor domain-containing protein
LSIRNWTQRGGYQIPDATALAETPDGFLWIGTLRGLLKFDGVNFTQVPIEGTAAGGGVRVIKPSRNGGWWIATAESVIRFADGKTTAFGVKDGIPPGRIMTLAEDAKGVLWVGTAGEGGSGLASIERSAVRKHPGLPNANVLSLYVDDSGALWVGMISGACRWLPQELRSCTAPSAMETTAIGRNASGEIVAADATGKSLVSLRVVRDKLVATPFQATGVSTRTMLLDKQGNLWVASLGRGLLRFRDGKLESLTQRDGLSSDVVGDLLEDRQGNLWVATARGLDRLRDSLVARSQVLENLTPGMISLVSSGKDGGLWVGTINSGAMRIRSGDVHVIKQELPSVSVLSFYEDPQGVPWFGTTGGLASIQNGKSIRIRTAGGQELDRVMAITGDSESRLWVADTRQGLLQIEHNQAAPVDLPGTSATGIYALRANADGLLWIGYYDGTIRSVRSYDSKYRVEGEWEIGSVRSIASDPAGVIWAGTESGISRYSGGAWTHWGRNEGVPEGGVHSLLIENSSLWATSSSGLIQVNLPNFKKNADGTPARLKFSLIGPSDGMELGEVPPKSNPRMAIVGDSLLVLTEDGVRSLSPGKVLDAEQKLVPLIEEFTADGKLQDLTPGRQVILSPVLNVRFRYTAPNLSSGETMRFRYMLEGADRSWVESGSEREARYGALAPGDYRFRVAVRGYGADDDGEAGVSFRVNPPFYRSWYFLTLLAAVTGAGIWALHRSRVKMIDMRLRMAYEERLRLTRELHDTLLQGFAGVVFLLEAASRKFRDSPAESQAGVLRALEQADQATAEARRAISLMRLPALEGHLLSEALKTAGKNAAEGTGIHVSIDVDSLADTLPYQTQANLFIIGRELLTNAVAHGNPRTVKLSLTCDQQAFQLIVEDDGVGFDPSHASSVAEGHLGLTAMRERAASIKATFEVQSSPGHGSKILVQRT